MDPGKISASNVRVGKTAAKRSGREGDPQVPQIVLYVKCRAVPKRAVEAGDNAANLTEAARAQVRNAHRNFRVSAPTLASPP